MKVSTVVMWAAVLLPIGGGAAFAEQWVDYAPTKGAYVKTLVHVEPDKMDVYLTALRKTWIPGEEMAKKRGLIDSYTVQVNSNPYLPGPNVVLIEHYPTMATMDPDRARDMAMDKEFEKVLPRAEAPALATERGKYRTIVSQEMWGTVEFPK